MKLQKLWDIDPGYFRFKHALKTILAILIALALMRNESLFIKLIAGLVSGFSMQGVVAKSLSIRIVQVILLDLAFFVAFVLGLYLRDCAQCAAIALVVLGFAVNYIRRFGLQVSTAPMMIWTVCFLATVLPFTDTLEIWNHLYGVIVALIVSACVTLLIFPERYPQLFVSNSNRLLDTLTKGMHQFRRHVHRSSKKIVVKSGKRAPFRRKNKSSTFERLVFFRYKNTLFRLLESNQAIEQSDVFGAQSEQISDSLMEQYALVHVYTMMIDAYQALDRHQLKLPKSVCRKLSMIYRQFASIFSSLSMQSNGVIVSKASIQDLLPVVITFEPPSSPDPALLLILLNLNLSFNLFNRHLEKIIQGAVPS